MTREPLSLTAKVLYGSGTIAFGIKDQGFSALLMLYYNQVIGLPAQWVGAAIMIAMVLDALIDPLLGQVSDDFRSRWGRRLPFMYSACVPAGLAYLLLWMPPDWPQEALFAYLVVVSVLVRMAISLYEIPSTALLAEFSNDYDERTKLVAFRYFFGVMAGVVMTIVVFDKYLKPDARHPVGQLNPAGYVDYAWMAAGVIFLSMLLSTLGTHRQAIEAGSAPAARAQRPTLRQLVREMAHILFHPTYLSVLLASLFAAMGAGLTMALGVYFSTYFWTFTAEQIALLGVGALGGIFLAFALALPVATQFGKKPSAMVLLSLSVVSSASPLLLRLAGFFPENGDPALMPLLIVQLAITTMCIIAGSILAVSMVADVTEQVQLSTGRRAEGLLFSAATMVNKAVSGMGIFISGLVLSFVDFPANAKPGEVPEDVLVSLATFYISSTLVLSVLAIASLAFYPITRADHAEAVRKLSEQQS